MSLLRSAPIEAALREITRRRVRRTKALRTAMFGADGTGTPVGFVRPQGVEKTAFLRGMLIRAEREEEGRAPGDLASQAVDTPAMQRVIAEEVSDATS